MISREAAVIWIGKKETRWDEAEVNFECQGQRGKQSGGRKGQIHTEKQGCVPLI